MSPTLPARSPRRPLLRRLRRFLVLRRAWVIGALTGVAVLGGLQAVSPTPTAPSTRAVVVAARDLPAGRPLTGSDVVVRRLPLEAVPGGATGDPSAYAGRTLAGAVRAGEVLTDRRVLVPATAAGDPGTVATPVRIADAAVAGLLRPGDRVDLVAASADGRGRSWVVAAGALVVARPRVAGGSSPGGGLDPGLGGGLVVVAVPEDEAVGLVGAASSRPLGVILRG